MHIVFKWPYAAHASRDPKLKATLQKTTNSKFDTLQNLTLKPLGATIVVFISLLTK